MPVQYYLQKLTKHPPHITAYKILRKIAVRIKVEAESLKANLFSTYISDKQLLESLVDSISDTDELLKHIRERKQPNFFFQPSDRNKMVDMVRSHYPNAIKQTIADADKICDHVFNLLGSGDVHLGEKIDWHTDFKTGWRWKLKYYKKVDYNDLNNPYDVKAPWELSRCQHFVTLGKAYWFVKEHEVQVERSDIPTTVGGAKCEVKDAEKYAGEFVNQVSDWIDSNPPKMGVNWTCTMDVAIRVVNWIWGYYFFKDSPCLTGVSTPAYGVETPAYDEFLLKFLKSILAHGRHIMNNLENKGMVTSNHYLSDIAGLVYLGVMFPEFKEAKKWREFGIQELINEMDKQVYPDGMDFEASTSYHRLVLELFTYSALLCKLNGIELPKKIWDKLEKMFYFTLHCLKPNGQIPQIGDNDSGRFLVFKKRDILEHTYLLSIGSVLFDNPDFKVDNPLTPFNNPPAPLWKGDKGDEKFGFDELILWLFGVDGYKRWLSLPCRDKPIPSKAFTDGGIYIMREADDYMVISCGPNGPGSHAHCDKLSFELHIDGQDVIVDPGTYVYTASPKWRNLFRSTSYHNTVVVDEKEQNSFDDWNLFGMQDDSKAKMLKLESNDEHVLFAGEHYGYLRLQEPIIHRRTVRYLKKERIWQIIDKFLPGGDRTKEPKHHTFTWFLHLAPALEATPFQQASGMLLHDREFIISKNGSQLLRVTFEDSPSIEWKQSFCTPKIEDGWYSPEYGVKEPAKVLSWELECFVPFTFKWSLCA